MQTIAFIDGQNLYSGVKKGGWVLDYRKLRVYLKRKYNVSEALYFLGYRQEKNERVYISIQDAGYTIIFKENNQYIQSLKKGNVDSDIIFEAMRIYCENKVDYKLILVSGDGDYIKLVTYFIQKEKFNKILFPNKAYASSLYKKFGSEFYDYLDSINVKEKIKRAP